MAEDKKVQDLADKIKNKVENLKEKSVDALDLTKDKALELEEKAEDKIEKWTGEDTAVEQDKPIK